MSAGTDTARPAMLSARAPGSAGHLALVGVVLAVLTVALGLVGVRDALVSAGALSGTSWIEGGVDAADGLQAQWWMVPVGALLVLLGLWLAWTALRPRARRGAAVGARTGVFLRPRDLRVLARQAAADVDGVIDADAKASRNAVSIRATVTADDGRIADDIRTAVQQALSPLDSPPRIKVRADPEGLA